MLAPFGIFPPASKLLKSVSTCFHCVELRWSRTTRAVGFCSSASSLLKKVRNSFFKRCTCVYNCGSLHAHIPLRVMRWEEDCWRENPTEAAHSSSLSEPTLFTHIMRANHNWSCTCSQKGEAANQNRLNGLLKQVSCYPLDVLLVRVGNTHYMLDLVLMYYVHWT